MYISLSLFVVHFFFMIKFIKLKCQEGNKTGQSLLLKENQQYKTTTLEIQKNLQCLMLCIAHLPSFSSRPQDIVQRINIKNCNNNLINRIIKWRN